MVTMVVISEKGCVSFWILPCEATTRLMKSLSQQTYQMWFMRSGGGIMELVPPTLFHLPLVSLSHAICIVDSSSLTYALVSPRWDLCMVTCETWFPVMEISMSGITLWKYNVRCFSRNNYFSIHWFLRVAIHMHTRLSDYEKCGDSMNFGVLRFSGSVLCTHLTVQWAWLHEARCSHPSSRRTDFAGWLQAKFSAYVVKSVLLVGTLRMPYFKVFSNCHSPKEANFTPTGCELVSFPEPHSACSKTRE